jgi:hypothetical protein
LRATAGSVVAIIARSTRLARICRRCRLLMSVSTRFEEV